MVLQAQAATEDGAGPSHVNAAGSAPNTLSQLVSSGEVAFAVFSVESVDALELESASVYLSPQRVFSQIADTGMLDFRKSMRELVRERKESNWCAAHDLYLGYVEDAMQEVAAMVKK